MEYENDFEQDFMRRTLTLVNDYGGNLDATLLVNCLLGLLVLPKETLYEKIPKDDFDSLSKWGIRSGSIKPGKCAYGHEHQPNLRQVVKKLRNAVAYFKVEPFNAGDKVGGFSFEYRDGFRAKLSLDEIKTFVTCLAKHLGGEAFQEIPAELTEAEFEVTTDQLADTLAADLDPNAPSLSDYAVSRKGIYEDHP